jgi:RNA polymerase sigma factor (sigma-70 family)
MDLTDSHKLLRDYADRGNESAFQELVNRYIDLVYSTALRRVGGNADAAQDVTQAVFTDLARKAHSFRGVDMLGGWLHRHTGFVASNFVRSEQRRQIREQEAAQMNALADSPDAVWQQLSPVLDETIDSLEPADRQAILLRFFERHDFRSIGATLGISDDAAQKRVSRALEKLKDLLARRGVTLSVVLLGTLMAGKVVKAAPADLAIKVATLALAGARVVGVAATLAKVANSLAFKIALAAIVIATAAKWILSSHSAPPVETARQGNAGVPEVLTQTVSTPAPEIQVPVVAPAAQETPPNSASNILELTIVSADSGKPIPNVHLEYFLGVHGESRRKKPLQTTSSGTCEVPVPDGTTELILVSQIDGFADTRLKWDPDHGQVIPAQYTLRVARSVPIGGTVVDPDGNPVAGADVVFDNPWPDPALDARIETDNFGSPGVTTTTDAQGRWQINRVGKGAIHFICGSASHPDYVDTPLISTSRDPIAEKQLLASTYVFSLRHAVAVRGVVQDSNGQPVPGAKVLVGRLHFASSRTTNSQPDGTFFVSGCEPGKNMVTAEAEGYAATTLDVDLADNSAPVQLVLRPGHMLKLKVVDTDGNPVPKASVWFDSDSFNHVNQTAPSPTRAQADFQRSTDQNGLLEWDSAPDGDLTFAASATGYMNSGSIQLRADGTEHLITLQPGLTISGTVTDGTTGQPIPRFRVITGWPENNPTNDSINAQWSTIDRFWMTFDGGKFEHTYDEPASVGPPISSSCLNSTRKVTRPSSPA